jgi:hypothetical protein
MYDYSYNSKLMLRAVSSILIITFLVTGPCHAYQGPLTSTLAPQSLFKPLVDIQIVNGQPVITELNADAKSIILDYVQRDAEIMYFNLLKDRLKELEISNVGLKRYIREHIEILYQAKKSSVLLSELKGLRVESLGLIKSIDIALEFYEEKQVKTQGLEEIENLIKPLELILDNISKETDKIDDVVAINSELFEISRNIHQKLTYDYLIGVLEEAYEELLAKEKAFQMDDEFSHERYVSRAFKDMFYLKNVLDSFSPERNKDEDKELGEIINQPGLLVHGIDINRYESKEIRRKKIHYVLSAGILPHNKIPAELKGREDKFALKPDVVGLSMVGNNSGYMGTGTVRHEHGVSELNREQASLTFILSPTYVSEHNKEFNAIGKGFFESDNFRDESGEVYGHIPLVENYSFSKRVSLEGGGIYYDEVVVASVPPEAIVGIIVSEIFASSLLEIIVKEFPERPMCIFNPEGKLLFDIKGASQILEELPSVGENFYEENSQKMFSPKGEKLVKVDTEVHQKWAQTFIDDLRIRAYEAKKLKQNIIIGLDTSWIPKEQLPYLQELLNQLSRMSQKEGLDNIIIRRRNGKEIASVVRNIAKGTNTPSSNIIFLGSEETFDFVNTRAFDDFREGLEPDAWAFFAEVNLPKDFSQDSYIRIIEMLTKTLSMWAGNPKPEDTEYLKIRQDKKDGKRIIKLIIPEAEPRSVELLKELYSGQLKAMKSA